MFATPSYGHLDFTQSLHLAVELYTNIKPREWNELEKNLKINDLQKGEKIKVTRNNDTKMNSRLKWNDNKRTGIIGIVTMSTGNVKMNLRYVFISMGFFRLMCDCIWEVTSWTVRKADYPLRIQALISWNSDHFLRSLYLCLQMKLF